MSTNTSDTPTGYVKQSRVLTFVMIGFLAGFLSGILLTVYKLPATPPAVSTSPPRQGGPGPAVDTQGLQQRLAELQAQVAETPDQTDIWIRIGDIHFDLNQPKEAVGAYRKSLELNPANADVWTDMGVMYRRLGQPEEALAAFDQAIAVEPEHEISRYNKGVVLMHDLEDPFGAIAAWDELLTLNPMAITGTGQPLRDMLHLLKQRLPAEATES